MRIYNFISSMNAGLILLALIGIVSAIGSSLWPDIFFKTVYFRLLLLLFFVNMALCTCNSISRFIKQNRNIIKNKRQMLRSICLVMLHLGIVLIIIGAGLNSWLGHSVQLSILQGDTVNINKVIPAKTPFDVKLLDFKITFNDDGSPAQYYSALQVSSPGQKDYHQTISVNHPLTYAGVKFYQNSFGYLLDAQAEDGKAAAKSLQVQDGDFISFAATSKTVKIFKYIPHFDPALGMQSKSLQPVNPRVVYTVYNGKVFAGVGAASFNERIKIDDNVFITFQQVRPYSILTVKTDPGLPLTTTGGILLMLGISIVLLMPRNKPTVLPNGFNEREASEE
ncbi:MAG TPA: cytochrome c biogenesis protein ResB [Syntrophomonas sp.]|nr:cytochrome c biogenesis protein ResB [Syntrophomonas sp.]